MAIGTPVSQTTGTKTSPSPGVTASITIPAGHHAYCWVIAAQSSGGTPNISGVTGHTLTWTAVNTTQQYGARRSIRVFRAYNNTGAGTTGTISITVSASAGSFQEMMWAVETISGLDTTTPNDAPVTDQTGPFSSSLTLADVGTPGSGDAVYAGFGYENALADSFDLEAAFTNISTRIGGGNCRSLYTGIDLTAPLDETPGVTWATSDNNSGGVAFILNAAAGGALEVDADAGSFALTGTAASLEFGREVVGSAGSFAITGTAASPEYGREVAAAGGSFAITGSDATLAIRARAVTATGGSFALTGTAASLEYGREVAGEAGSFALTGSDAALELGREVAAEAGSYALTGSDADLSIEAPGAFEVDAEAGAFDLTGSDASLEIGREVAAEGGEYELTGADAGLSIESEGAFSVNADEGAFALSGSDATLEIAREIEADAGSYDLTGSDATLAYAAEIDAEGGAFDFTGSDAALESSAEPAAPVPVGRPRDKRRKGNSRVKREWEEKEAARQAAFDPPPVVVAVAPKAKPKPRVIVLEPLPEPGLDPIEMDNDFLMFSARMHH